MSIKISDLKIYGSASMPDDDSVLNMGGAISTSKKVELNDISPSGNVQVVSSAAGDTTQSITTYGRNAGGALINEAKTLNGVTPVVMTGNTTWERLLKAVKGATCAGDVAVESVTAVRANTCQAGSTTDEVVLDAAASAADDFYLGMVFRTTGGTGSNQIRQIVKYVGSTKKATMSSTLGTGLDATTTFKISNGMYFDKAPVEIMEVRRPFYNASAPGAGTRKYYEKIFVKNTHATLILTSAVAKEGADPSGKIAFGLASALDDSGGNGGGNNRQVAPAAITFDSADKNVVNSQNLTNGSAQGVWLELSLAAGDAATKTSYTLRNEGNTT